MHKNPHFLVADHAPFPAIAYLLPILIALFGSGNVRAAIRYVDADCANATPPYTSWATGARTIQDAVDVASTGDEIVVTNGMYATGGRTVGAYLLTNRVAVDKPLTIRSVNGPEFTLIQGYQVPGATNGGGAVRCVYLADGAFVSGFTLTNGATLYLGGATNQSQFHDSRGGGACSESRTTILSNCVLVANAAQLDGGGAFGGTLVDCTLRGNNAEYGGGAWGATLTDCTVVNNFARVDGGGADVCNLDRCMLVSNSARWGGGGACDGTLKNCRIVNNAAEYGGGAATSDFGECTLENCLLTGNSATTGGGAYVDKMVNCTVVGNLADRCGGVGGGCLTNCIVFYNKAVTMWDNYPSVPAGGFWSHCLSYCCTTPTPPTGIGNMTADPQLADASHLSADSPCRGAGLSVVTGGTDIDGERWAVPPSIGCDEYSMGATSGPLRVSILTAFTNVAAGYTLELTALIEGHASGNAWTFGDGTSVSNRLIAAHSWAAPGDYAVVVRVHNESHPEGVTAAVTVRVSEAVHYVVAGNAGSLAPYASWATAATNIQDAVDVALPGAVVLVSNGVYVAGGRTAGTNLLLNRVVVEKPIHIRSANGPQCTSIVGHQVLGTTNGDGAVRCAYLCSGASLTGFTITNGATRTNGNWYTDVAGGGVWCDGEKSVVSNCCLIGNAAHVAGGGTAGGTVVNCTIRGNSAGSAGGAFGGTLINCEIVRNRAGYGGGASGYWLYQSLLNCTVCSNSATRGGGVDYANLKNCLVYFNNAPEAPNYYPHAQEGLPWEYCCTMPLPSVRGGNITNTPLFVDLAGGDLRPQSNSPCINAGNNSYLTDSNFTNWSDLNGNPRIVSGTVDIGAYEYQGPGSRISYAWLRQFGLATDGSVDDSDLDGDGHTTCQEWRCQTDPTNCLSALRLLSASSDGTNVVVTWQSVTGISYSLECATNLVSATPFRQLATDIPGEAGTTAYRDTDPTNQEQRFYRVGVR